MTANNDDMNEPDFGKVAYDLAVETVSNIYKDLRKKGLSRMDAAAIVASILKSDEGLENA